MLARRLNAVGTFGRRLFTRGSLRAGRLRTFLPGAILYLEHDVFGMLSIGIPGGKEKRDG